MILYLNKLLFQKLLPTLLIMWCLSAMGIVTAEAGTWRVSPIKVYFDVKTRSDVITVTNDGDQNLALEITAMEWTQDPEGQDIYQPATDLVFFPKQLTVEPKKERVIRTGIKVPAVNREKTYRLFIKEVPDRSQMAPNTVAIAIQFGVPVFIKPVQEDIAGAISNAQIVNSSFSAIIENNGNKHFHINTIMLKGKSAAGDLLFSQEFNGWYLLNGSSRNFTASVPDEICQQLSVLDIQINADLIKFNGRVDVDQTMCSAP